MMTQEQLTEAVAWLADLPNAVDLRPSSPVARGWLGRLGTEAIEAHVTGADIVAACRQIARTPGAFFPTPGQIVTAAHEARVERAREERETEYRDRKLIDPTRPNESPGWSNGRSLTADYRAVQDLVRRGHPGQSCGGSYTAAVLREERERQDAEERGREYQPRVYGPSLEAPTNPMRRMARNDT